MNPKTAQLNDKLKTRNHHIPIARAIKNGMILPFNCIKMDCGRKIFYLKQCNIKVTNGRDLSDNTQYQIKDVFSTRQQRLKLPFMTEIAFDKGQPTYKHTYEYNIFASFHFI